MGQCAAAHHEDMSGQTRQKLKGLSSKFRGSFSDKKHSDGNINIYEGPIYPMKLLKAESFQDNSIFTKVHDDLEFFELSSLIDQHRADYFIIYVSYRSSHWKTAELPSHDTKQNDIQQNEEFQNILMRGIEKVNKNIHNCNESIKVMVWVDFLCFPTDKSVKDAIDSLPAYIANSDAILTPLILGSEDQNLGKELSFPLEKFCAKSTKYRSLSNHPEEYFGRKWCRLELSLGQAAPLPEESFKYFEQKKIKQYEGADVLRKGRPHFFFTESHANQVMIETKHQAEAEGQQDKPHICLFGLFCSTCEAKGESSAQKKKEDGAAGKDSRMFFGNSIEEERGGLPILPELDRRISPFFGEVTNEEDRELINTLAHKMNEQEKQDLLYNFRLRSNSVDRTQRSHGMKLPRMSPVKCKQEIAYPDGSAYNGDCVNGMKEGKGKYTYYNGSWYDGYWKKDKMHGTGIYTWVNGNMYEGAFHEGLCHGDGKLYMFEKRLEKKDPQKKEPVFLFKKDEGSETGKLYRLHYDGEWEAGTKHGEGSLLLENGDTYEGSFEYDLKHGLGEYKWVDNQRYLGEWSEGKRHGLGKMTWPTETPNNKAYRFKTYVGMFRKGKMAGVGELTYSKNEKYWGHLEDNKRHGFGLLIWDLSEEEKTALEKALENSKQSGKKGRQVQFEYNEDGATSENIHYLTTEEVQEILKLDDSNTRERFEGEFRQDRQHYGKHFCKDGRIFKGEYTFQTEEETGKIVSSKRRGTIFNNKTKNSDIGEFKWTEEDPFVKHGKVVQHTLIGYREEKKSSNASEKGKKNDDTTLEGKQQITKEDAKTEVNEWIPVKKSEVSGAQETNLKYIEDESNEEKEEGVIYTVQQVGEEREEKEGEQVVVRRTVHLWKVRTGKWEDNIFKGAVDTKREN